MSWIGDVFSGKVDAVPFLENPFNGNTDDNDQSIRGGRTEANRGVWWKGANGHYYTNDGARGVVDRGTNYSPPGGYSQIADPNPPKGATGGTNKTASNTGGSTLGASTAAPVKVLDTAQLASLDSLIESLGTVKAESLKKAGIKRDTSKREKQEERTREEGKYQGKKLSTLQDFAGAKTDTDLNTTATLENLVSSLSTLGLGGSRALTRQILDAANKANRKANATQATNNQNLDSSWNEYSVGNDNDVRKIEDQYGFDAGEAEKAYLSGKQNALYKKADVYNAVDDTGSRQRIMDEASGLNAPISRAAFTNPAYTGEAKAMATPELADYAQDIATYETALDLGSGMTPVDADGNPAAGNLAVKAVAVNDKDLGIKKKTEGELAYGV